MGEENGACNSLKLLYARAANIIDYIHKAQLLTKLKKKLAAEPYKSPFGWRSIRELSVKKQRLSVDNLSAIYSVQYNRKFSKAALGIHSQMGSPVCESLNNAMKSVRYYQFVLSPLKLAKNIKRKFDI